MNSDGCDEECLVEKLRKELRDLTWEEEEAKQRLQKHRYKNEEAEKERNEIKLILEKEEMEIAKKEEELQHFRVRVQLRLEKIDNMRQQIFINQMRKAEADQQIEELRKTLEEVKMKEKANQQLLTDRLKAVQHKLLNASWVISRRKEKEELAGLCERIDEVRGRKERLLQSIREKEAILTESRELPFTNFCVAIAAITLKNRALLKKLAQEYVTIAQLTQELSSQGILDTSILSQYSQSQTGHIQPLEEKIEESSLCDNVGSADACEQTVSFDCSGEKNAVEDMAGDIHLDFQKKVDPSVTIPTLDDGKLEENVKIIIINEEVEKTASHIAMEVDKNHESHQISNELKTDATRFEEGIIDINEKNVLVENISPSQTSDKDNNIDSNFISSFIDSSVELETGVSGGSEGENTADFNDGECEPVPGTGINLQPMQSASSDLDPSNFFESQNGAMSNFFQDQSGSVAGGANDYMALFGGVDTNASSHDNEGFELNFGNSPDGNEAKDGIDKNRFFGF